MSQEVCRPGSSRQWDIPQSRTRQRYWAALGRGSEDGSVEASETILCPGRGDDQVRSATTQVLTRGAHSVCFVCGVAGDVGKA